MQVAEAPEEEEKIPEDERVEEEREWDNERVDLDAEYAMPDMGSLMDDSTTVADHSVAATPGIQCSNISSLDVETFPF